MSIDVVLVFLQPDHLVGVEGPVLKADSPRVRSSAIVNVRHALKNSENEKRFGIENEG